jgi:murein DD-endopeptidase MepM/ murein hydrolase activator NlpD
MSGYGYLVQITHNNGYVTYYGHNSRLLVKSGQHVYKGQQIAAMGSTGNSTGNHCHFEIRLNGVAKNPLNYLR